MGDNVTRLGYNFCYCKHGLEQESSDTCRSLKKTTTSYGKTTTYEKATTYGKTTTFEKATTYEKTIVPTITEPQPPEPGSPFNFSNFIEIRFTFQFFSFIQNYDQNFFD